MPLDIPLRKRITAGEQAAGGWLTLPSTAIARTIASTLNISWVLIDGEHGLINDSHFYDLANTVASAGASPIIRVPAEEIWLIKRALDAGAHGLMVPMANNVEIVRKVVQATKYPPAGIRGFGPMFTHATGALGAKYKETADADLVIAVQIEHPQAVEEIDQICQEGIDVAFIGPYDLSISMGVEFGGKEHEDAISKILAACKKHKKYAAIFCLNGDQAAERFAQGFDMVSVTTDIDTLTDGFATALLTATGKFGAGYKEHARPPLFLFGCGASQYGQLGGIFPTEIPKPARVAWVTQEMSKGTFGGTDAGIESVAAGGFHTLFVDEMGTVWSCGSNDDAALGYKTPEGFDQDVVETPQVVEALRKDGFRAVKISAGSTVSAAISDEGELRVWGTFKAAEGKLGFAPGTEYQHEPITLRPPSLRSNSPEKFVSVAVGAHHIITLTTHGNVYTWGVGELGQLGRKVPDRRKIHGTIPERVVLSARTGARKAGSRSRKAVAVGAGSQHSFAVDDQGDVWAFGLNNNGQLGIGATNTRDDAAVLSPTKVANLSKDELDGATVVQISGGEAHTLFLTSDGRVFACGQHDIGQIGLPEDDPLFIVHPGSIPFPVQVPVPDSDDPVVRISTSTRGNWAVTADGALYAWGEANTSELGVPDDSTIRTPQVVVRRDGGWRAEEVACGGQHSVCLLRRRT
ncbi:hypothetical protein PQX77_000684 [Marasmius sp. AFHP31]|nr:hypothetical protein PQX77_011051 [Marasmius sp. AFHP31]KAK1236094.1 hypothetical protein PQX77_000684 [Marasmius sp. AFHP31]